MGRQLAAYYNEFDPYAAQWLRNLIAAGHIAPGDVDERSIIDVQADDLAGYSQCHFFAGIGGWSLGLRLAGWPDDRPVWTGSCPCQPLSSAGQRKGHADERHLWPAFHRLIAERRPATVFGEQVASKDGREWFAGVRADLEALGYACGGADLCAAGVGAPHIRQRLWWVADADQGQRRRITDSEGRERHGQAAGRVKGDGVAESGRLVGRVADAERDTGRPGRIGEQSGSGSAPKSAGAHAQSGRRSNLGDVGLEYAARDGRVERGTGPSGRGTAGGRGTGRVGNADQPRPQGRRIGPDERADQRSAWSSGVFIPCADGKARRVEPGIQPLVNGLPVAVDGLSPISRVGALRGAGNAIVPQVGAEFITAFLSCRP